MLNFKQFLVREYKETEDLDEGLGNYLKQKWKRTAAQWGNHSGSPDFDPKKGYDTEPKTSGLDSKKEKTVAPQSNKKPNSVVDAFMKWHTATPENNPSFRASPKPEEKKKPEIKKKEYGTGEPGKGHPGEKTIYKKADNVSPVKQKPLPKPKMTPIERDPKFAEMDRLLQQISSPDDPMTQELIKMMGKSKK